MSRLRKKMSKNNQLSQLFYPHKFDLSFASLLFKVLSLISHISFILFSFLNMFYFVFWKNFQQSSLQDYLSLTD